MVKDNEPRINNIQNLLQVAIQHQDANSSNQQEQPIQMDENRRQFLENALRLITTDHVEVLKKQIEKLNELVDKLNGYTPLSEEENKEYISLLEELVENVSNIDFANDFYKLNGFKSLTELIDCELLTFKASALDVIAELLQNNDFLQIKVVEEMDYLNKLINLIRKEKHQQTLLKEIYALSCLLRGNDKIINIFLSKDFNVKVLLEVMVNFKTNEKIIFKLSFLLNSIGGVKEKIYEILNRLDFVFITVNMMKEKPEATHEYLLAILVALCENISRAIEDCKKYNLRLVIDEKIKLFENKDEYLEEVDYCKKLKELIK